MKAQRIVFTGLLLWVFLSAGMAWAQATHFLVRPLGPVDLALVTAVTNHLHRSFHQVPFLIGAPVTDPAETPQAAAQAIHRELDDATAGVLVLLDAHDELLFQMGVFPELRVAILNTARLRADLDFVDRATELRFLRRVRKESVRAIGLLLELPPIPFPRCAMCPWERLEELDGMGNNLSPPNSVQAERRLRELGLLKDSRW